jgi:hypothetical protein
VIITDSDRNLWLAVIHQALDDLTATKTPLKEVRALGSCRRIGTLAVFLYALKFYIYLFFANVLALVIVAR